MCLRILHVVGVMQRGGIETLLMNLYRHLDLEKVQFDFIVHGDIHGEYEEEIKELGGRIFRVPQYRGINHLDYIRAWGIFLQKHSEYQIIHGHLRSTAAIYLKIAKKYNRFTIAHSHNTDSRGNWIERRIKGLYQYPIRFRADYFLACSYKAGEWLFGKRVCTGNQFKILNNAIDVEAFLYNATLREKKRGEELLGDKFVIGHIGNFSRQKNHPFILKVFERVCEWDENCVLVLVGGGDRKVRENIEMRTSVSGLDNKIKFLGSRSDVNELMNAFDVFLFPSLHEGLGMAAIEAQANGLKCVLSDVIPREIEITDNVNFLSLQEPVDIWAHKILSYKNNYTREDMRECIKDQGYDIRENVKWLTEFYQGIMRRERV